LHFDIITICKIWSKRYFQCIKYGNQYFILHLHFYFIIQIFHFCGFFSMIIHWHHVVQSKSSINFLFFFKLVHSFFFNGIVTIQQRNNILIKWKCNTHTYDNKNEATTLIDYSIFILFFFLSLCLTWHKSQEAYVVYIDVVHFQDRWVQKQPYQRIERRKKVARASVSLDKNF